MLAAADSIDKDDPAAVAALATEAGMLDAISSEKVLSALKKQTGLTLGALRKQAGTATANLMSVMLTYETFYNDTSYMGTGQTIAASDTNTKIYNSANSFSIIESVKFVNLQPITVPITCYWGDANGVPKAHLAFGLQLPPNTSIELLQSTKRINQGDALYASYTAGAGNGVSAFVSARYGPAYTIDTFTSSVFPGNTITASFGTSANEGTSLYYTIE